MEAMSMPDQPTAGAVAYCRTCGTPVLNATPDQIAQGLVFCSVHQPQAAPPPFPGANNPNANPWATGVPPAYPAVATSPGLAFVLGFIPGVGAVYNAQYGKGLLHALITGLIITMLDSPAGGPLLGILLGAWFFYMAFEAYHTARKRQMGIPVDEFSSLLAIQNSDGRMNLAGPLILIGIGGVLLLNNLEIIHFYQIVRFWPVALILLGVYLLYGRVSAGRS